MEYFKSDINFENKDLFSRKDIAENLIKVFDETKVPMTIAIDSYWGSGKSTFIEMWRNLLSEKKFGSIYLDAWENDYYVDPIVPIVGVLEEFLEVNNANSDDLKNAMKIIVYEIIKSFSKVVDLEKIEESLKSEIRMNAATYNDLKNQKESIKNALAKLSEDKKVYFFIDELDRCKPSFSIALLERLKHYLDVPNFVFVFAVDLSQLGASVKTLYGQIDTTMYFRKFFDFTFNLPAPSKEKYFEYLFTSNGIDTPFRENYIYYTWRIIEHHPEVGLRECEKIYNIIRVCNSSIIKISGNEYLFPILIVLKVIDPKSYKLLLNKEKDIDSENFGKWNLDSVYDSNYEHVKKMIRGYGPVKIEVRRQNLQEDFNQSGYNAGAVGLLNYANEVLEFENLF